MVTISRRRTVLATMSGSTAVMLIVTIQAIVLAPLFLRELGAPVYGAWLATGELLVWLQAFDLGLPNLLIQRIGAAHARGDSSAVGEYLASGCLVLGSISIIVAGGVVTVAPAAAPLMGITGPDAATFGSALAVAGAAAAATLGTNAAVGFARGIQRTGFMSAVGVASALIGFVLTLTLLLSGWGLWAAAFGVASRAAVLVIGATVFIARHLRAGLAPYFRVRRAVSMEMLSVSPVTALGGLAYAGMNQGETALVAIAGRPDLAAAYALTRRAADLARALIDMIGAAAYGSFAHLVASEARDRALAVHSEISTLRLSLAVVAAGTYLAANASLVGAWVGPSQYLGLLLSTAFAAQMLVVGHGYLFNYLYRATGAVVAGSWMLLAEALVRVPLMLLLFFSVGVVGVPVAGIFTAALFGGLAWSWTRRDLSPPMVRPRRHLNLHLVAVHSAVLLGGIAVGASLQMPSWSWALTIGGTFGAAALAAVLLVDSRSAAILSDVRTELRSASRVVSG